MPEFCGEQMEVYEVSQRPHPEGKSGLFYSRERGVWEANITTEAKFCGYAKNNTHGYFYICRRCAQRQGLIW